MFKLNYTYQSLPKDFYQEQSPTAVAKPKLLLFNEELVEELSLKPLGEEELSALLSGNKLNQEMRPIAQAYAGHQFGHFTMLGDGRAILLGEQEGQDGKLYDIVLKGAGQTPYSRGGDGRASRSSVLREYLISEAMYHLGIPTTRSLAAVQTGEQIMREVALDGAVLTRVASSHLRVGTFEYAMRFVGVEGLKKLIDYVIERHYPEAKLAENPTLAFFEAVLKRQKDLVLSWLRVGFIHGVMNTDNCSISGETLDYGPCAFMDEYDTETVFSYIDRDGRYAFIKQLEIIVWNMTRFAESLLPAFEDIDKAVPQLEDLLRAMYEDLQVGWQRLIAEKLGFAGELSDEVLVLGERLLALMQEHKLDYTNTFLGLTRIAGQEGAKALYDFEAWRLWQGEWEELFTRLSGQAERVDQMKQANPVIIPRNHLVEAVLSAAEEGDLEPLKQFLLVLKTPYLDSEDKRAYQTPPKEEERIQNTFCGT